MRSKTSCSSRAINVKMRVAVDCRGQQTLVWELLKHLLYMRNQTPSLYEDLERQVQVRAKKHSQLICNHYIFQHQLLHLQSLELEEHNNTQAATAALLNVQNNGDLSTDESPMKQRKGKRRLQTSQKRLCKVQGHLLAQHMLISHAISSHITVHQIVSTLQFVKTAQSMMHAVGPDCFFSGSSVHLILAFGSTPSRPLELYSMTLPAIGA